jgi:hypothetical protein
MSKIDEAEALKLALEVLEICEQDGYIPVRLTRDALTAIRQARSAPVQNSDHEFKNFHRLLCERFGYTHDEVNWKRDQISLIEWIKRDQISLIVWIAKQVKPAAPVQEPVAVARVDDLERGGRVRALAMGLALDAALYTTPAPAPVPLTDEQIDAATKAWFENDIVAGQNPFRKRMRAAFAAAHAITEKGGA